MKVRIIYIATMVAAFGGGLIQTLGMSDGGVI